MAMVKNATPNGSRTEYRKFVQADVESNHNKYWNVGLYDSGDVEIEHGRIGVTKTRWVEFDGGQLYYREIKTLDSSSPNIGKSLAANTLKQIARDQIIHTSPETTKLIEWLAEVNRHNITSATGGQIVYNSSNGAFETPLGVLQPDSIKEARKLLVDIGKYIDKKDFENKTLKGKVNDYLMLVPTNVGMKLNVEKLLPDLAAVQGQGQILDALDASYADITTQNTDDDQPVKQEKVFETKLNLLEDDKEFKRINDYFIKSRNTQHYNVCRMKIKRIWVVDITTMINAFDKNGRKIGNINELWHGTQHSNVLSILKIGLVIPPSSSSHVTGRMYGNGAYASSQSTKALNYATSFWGGKDVGRYFMFLLDMAMGNPFVPGKSRWGTSSNRYPVDGYDSTWAKPGTGVMNDERIVYKTNQVNLKYLIEFHR